VEDVLALLRALRSRPDIDPDRIALLGFSHGGCIALRVAAIDPRLAAVVAFSAPVEAAYTDRFLREHPLGMLGIAGWLRGQVESFVGATPEQAPEAWRARSPLYTADSLRQPLVLVQGTDDSLLPVQETCMLRDALHANGRPIAEGYFKPNGAPDRTPAPVCAPLPRLAESRRKEGPPVQIWYFEGEGHVFSRDAQNASLTRAADFLVRELHPPWRDATGPAR
jgi:dipeptidyl aminopeptidase/acylaminoacyl peptidase